MGPILQQGPALRAQPCRPFCRFAMTSLAALGPAPALHPPLSLGAKRVQILPLQHSRESQICPRTPPGQESGATQLHPSHWPSLGSGMLPPPRAVYRTGQQPLRSPTGWWHTHTPSLSSTLRSGREAGPGMHARPGANSMHIPRQVPLGKRKFGYVDLRMQSSRLAAWCCLLFQGLFWL